MRETAREEDELEKDEKDIQQNTFRMKYSIFLGSNFNRLKLFFFPFWPFYP